MAPAGRGGHHHRLQLPGGGVVVERLHRRRLRQRLHLEAIAEDANQDGNGLLTGNSDAILTGWHVTKARRNRASAAAVAKQEKGK